MWNCLSEDLEAQEFLTTPKRMKGAMNQCVATVGQGVEGQPMSGVAAHICEDGGDYKSLYFEGQHYLIVFT